MQLDFGAMGFFDAIDTNEALAHETALHHLARDTHGDLCLTKPSWRQLAFRKLIGASETHSTSPDARSWAP